MNKYISFLLVPIMLLGINSNNCYSIEDNNIQTEQNNLHNLRLQFLRKTEYCDHLVYDSGLSIDFVFSFYHFDENLHLYIRWLCDSLNNNKNNNYLSVSAINKKLPSFIRKLDITKSGQISIQQLSSHLITEMYHHAIQFANEIINNISKLKKMLKT